MKREPGFFYGELPDNPWHVWTDRGLLTERGLKHSSPASRR